MEHSKHSQLIYMSSVLIMKYRHAAETHDTELKNKIVETKRTLYRHKKYYYTLERCYAGTDCSESDSDISQF